MLIAVVNQSTLVPDAAASLMTRACAAQLRTNAAPIYDRTPAAVVFFPAMMAVPAGASTIALLDDSDQAGALGWHTEQAGGAMFGRVFARPVLTNGGDLLTLPLSVASVLSHEVLELFVDPHVNLWADDNAGTAYALEVCDPVESDSYTMLVDTTRVTVSNFVTPAWFDRLAGPHARLDWMGKVKAPFTMSAGGYVVVESEGHVTQRFGETYPPAWRQATKDDLLSRTHRRMANTV